MTNPTPSRHFCSPGPRHGRRETQNLHGLRGQRVQAPAKLQRARRETRGRFCSEHQLPGMEDVIHKTCEASGCKRCPSFNAPCETPGRFCSEHRLPGMDDVKHKTCEASGCKRCPSFNAPGEKRAAASAAAGTCLSPIGTIGETRIAYGKVTRLHEDGRVHVLVKGCSGGWHVLLSREQVVSFADADYKIVYI
eukprot:scaffold3535_cov107-Isochrysis_galbana.AAC.2